MCSVAQRHSPAKSSRLLSMVAYYMSMSVQRCLCACTRLCAHEMCGRSLLCRSNFRCHCWRGLQNTQATVKTEQRWNMLSTLGRSPRMPAQGPALVQLWVKSRWNLWFEPVHLRSFSYSLPKVSWKLTLETHLRPKPERWCAAFWKFPNLLQLLERPCNLLCSFFFLVYCSAMYCRGYNLRW